MKTFVMITGLILACLFGQAQLLTPAQWKFYAADKSVIVGEETVLYLEAELEGGWQLYSTDMDPQLGPMPAAVLFEPHPSYALLGEIEPLDVKEKWDPVWEGKVRYFERRARFRQRIRVLAQDPSIRGSLTYQLCSTANGRCIIGEEEFGFTGLRVLEAKQGEKQPRPVKASGRGKQLPPAEGGQAAPVDAAAVDTAALETGAWPADKLQQVERGFMTPPRPPEAAESGQSGPVGVIATQSGGLEAVRETSLWGFALLAFGAGLAALLTPCVFPIVPLTVTYFTFQEKGDGTKRRRFGPVAKALLYGLSVVLIYTGAGTLLAWLNGPAFANFLSTHWLPNLFFFAVFMLFALSFLGLFDIRLPAAWVSRVDRQADRGGVAGIFFMACTLTLVSFSCTGPIVGTLLVASAGGAVLLPLVGMAAFALAFALPFTLLALFPQWLKKLPHSGSWLNTVKVVLGFLELALGLKFLSVADQVYHWGILDRPIYLALWIVIFSCMGLYLLGKLPLSGEKAAERLGVPRLLLALGVFAFVVYLLPGMFGAPLKPLAGYLPPPKEAWVASAGGAASSALEGAADRGAGLCDPPLLGDGLHWPHGLQGYFALAQALACAREQGKPLFVAFTGHGCVNCREMEARVWSDPEVLRRLRRDFVLVALYVDDKTELSEADWYRSPFDGRLKKSVGMQNADYQIRRFGTNAQPYYAILDPATAEPLLPPVAYDLRVDNFIRFLDVGTKNYRALHARQLPSLQHGRSEQAQLPGAVL